MHSQQGDLNNPPTTGNLRAVINLGKVPKVIAGDNVVGTQFHPEYFYSSDAANRGFFQYFIRRAKKTLQQTNTSAAAAG